MKRIKAIIICAVLACGAIAGAALGIMAYQGVKAVEEKINGVLNIKKFLKFIPFKRKAK
jgi:zinc transporter ZupT